MPPQDELNLRDYWLILRKRRWLAALAFLAVILSTCWYTTSQIPVYTAESTVRVIERQTVTNLLAEFLSAGIMGDPMLSQTKVIKSQPILERTAQQLGWLADDAPWEEVTAQVRRLEAALEVSVIENTNVIKILAEHTDPIEAARIANAVAEMYVEYNLLEKGGQARALREFTAEQMADVEKTLRRLEDQVGLFKQQGEAKGAAMTLVAQLAKLRDDRASLLERFTELHPNVRRLDDRMAIVEQALSHMPDAEVAYAQVLREHTLAEGTYRTLRQKYDEARMAEAEKVSDIAIVNPALVPTKPTRPNKQLNYLLGFLVGGTFGLMCAFLVEHLDTSIGTIEDVEQQLELPVLGIIPYLHPPEQLKPEASWITEFRQWMMPAKPHRRALARLAEQTLIKYPPKSRVSDAFRLLRTNVRLEVFGNAIDHKSLLITSSGPDEGKTIITCNLAIAFAQEGRRVLLVDADLRRPHAHICFGLKKKEPGLTDILTDTCSAEQATQSLVELMMGGVGFDAAIQTPGLDNLSIITAGSTVDSPPDLLESKALGRFLEWARAQYDLVIMDAAPVLAVADPVLLAPRLDAVVLVYKVGKTARRAIQRSKMQLDSIKARVGGVIMNNISPEVELESGYYYRQYRYAYDQPTKGKQSPSGDAS